MKKQARARRQRVPALGEWNYDYGGDWPVTRYFDSTMQAGLVVAVPPLPKPVNKDVKWSDSGTLEDEKQRQHKVVLGLGEHGAVKKLGKQSRVADAADYKACRVVKAVDQDLYEITPDMLCHKPRARLLIFSLEPEGGDEEERVAGLPGPHQLRRLGIHHHHHRLASDLG